MREDEKQGMRKDYESKSLSSDGLLSLESMIFSICWMKLDGGFLDIDAVTCTKDGYSLLKCSFETAFIVLSFIIFIPFCTLAIQFSEASKPDGS